MGLSPRTLRPANNFTPRSITGLALWLDASSPETLFTTDAGAVTAVSSPTEISGCVGWWDASDAASITQSSGSVSQINDKSGLAAHASQGASGSRPTLIDNALNGRSILRFDGGDGLTGNFASSINTGAYSVFAVCKVTSMVTNGRVFSVAGASSDFASGMMIPCCTNASSLSQLSAYDGASGANKGAVDGFASYAVFSGVVGTSSLTNAANGMRAASASVTLNTAVTRFGIGTPAQGGAGGWNGDIAEVIYYSAALSNADRARVESYLAAKWGISGVHAPATATSDPVGAWLDKSGNARHATQSTAGSRPTISATAQNGKKQLALASTQGNCLSTSSLTLSAPYSLIAVVSSPSRRIGTFAGSGTNSNTQFGDGSATYSGAYYGASRIASVVYGSAPIAIGRAQVFSAVASSGTLPSALSMWADGIGGVAGTVFAGSPPPDNAVGGPLQIGATGTSSWGGTVCEMIAYSKELSVSDRQRIERYLAAKWGITLAPQVSNADAQSWINRVYINGGTVSSSTAAAVNTFCDAIDAASIRDRFYRLNLFAGGTSGTTAGLAACLVPLYRGPSLGGTQYGNTTDTNVGPFVVGDYSESNGLDGDGVGKYLNTGLSPDNMGVPQTVHLAAFKGAGTWNATREFMGSRDADDFYTMQCRYPASTIPSMSVLIGGSVSSINDTPVSTSASFLIGTRASSSELYLWQNGTKIATGSTAATTPGANSHPYMVFTRNASGAAGANPWEHAMRAYSIGLGLNDAQSVAYNTAMQTFQTALGRNV